MFAHEMLYPTVPLPFKSGIEPPPLAPGLLGQAGPELSANLNCRRTRDQVVMRPRATSVLEKSSLNPCNGEIGEPWLN